MNRLIDHGNYVTDTKTGLDWQKKINIDDWYTASEMTEPGGWRLPNKYELFGLIEVVENNPEIFGNPRRDMFWALAENGGYGGYVDFYSGTFNYYNPLTSCAVRLVRVNQGKES